MQAVAIVARTGASPATLGCHSRLQNMIERVRYYSGIGGQDEQAQRGRNLNLAGSDSTTATNLAEV